MTSENPDKQAIPPSQDGIPEAVIKKNGRLSIAWIIPLIALIAAGWLVYQTYSERGPVISIALNDASGLSPGKSSLKYRGVEVGTVIAIKFDETLSHLAVQVRLNKEASALAVEGSSFWIVKPTINLGNVSGLETIVSGVYIGSSKGKGDFQDKFVGLNGAPVIPLEDPGLSLELIASNSEGINPGTPLYYRRFPVGQVEKLEMAEDMSSVKIRIYIKTNYVSLVHSKTRFFNVARLSVSAGPGLLNVQVDSLKEFIQGGITFENFEPQTGAVPSKDLDRFKLYDNRILAENSGQSIELILDDASGINPLRTLIKHQGINVGIIESVEFDGGLNRIKARASLREEAGGLTQEGARYWVVRPKIGWEGVSGTETVFNGVYLDAIPGSGKPQKTFKVTNWSVVDGISTENPDGLVVKLHSPNLKIIAGAPVYYKNIPVGRIVSTGLSPDAKMAEMRALIFNQYKNLVRENSVFWNAGGVNASFGFLGMGATLNVAPLEALIAGGVSFATPAGPQLAAPAKPGKIFPVADKPQEDWSKWAPEIPLK